jgi:glycine/D-amino acid oxidase-like deaminating enzyme
MRTGELGFWWHSLGGPPAPRPPLGGPTEADIAIVGAGFTGLWTAYYLARADPSLRIVLLEAEVAGFGASGRNGGWLSGFFSGPPRVYERGRAGGGFAALQREMFRTVDEVAEVIGREGIEADLIKGGHLSVALDHAQLARLRETVAQAHRQGLQEADLRELGAQELGDRLDVAGALGATFSPHVARLHPAKLVCGLAAAVERLGVRI